MIQPYLWVPPRWKLWKNNYSTFHKMWHTKQEKPWQFICYKYPKCCVETLTYWKKNLLTKIKFQKEEQFLVYSKEATNMLNTVTCLHLTQFPLKVRQWMHKRAVSLNHERGIFHSSLSICWGIGRKPDDISINSSLCLLNKSQKHALSRIVSNRNIRYWRNFIPDFSH